MEDNTKTVSCIKANFGKLLILLVLTALLLTAFVYSSTRDAFTEKRIGDIAAMKAYYTEKMNVMSEKHQASLHTALANQKKQLLKQEMFKPVLGLAREQNVLCLAIVLFGEERMGNETDMVIIGQSLALRAMDPYWKESNMCSVAAAGQGVQYSSMGPYLTDIRDIVWGNITAFTPALAKKHKEDMAAWKRILKVSQGVIDGDYPQLTVANHFVSLKELKTVKSWIRAMRPVGTTTGHVMLVDHEIVDGKIVRYTKAKPYNQARFNKRHWGEGE